MAAVMRSISAFAFGSINCSSSSSVSVRIALRPAAVFICRILASISLGPKSFNISVSTANFSIFDLIKPVLAAICLFSSAICAMIASVFSRSLLSCKTLPSLIATSDGINLIIRSVCADVNFMSAPICLILALRSSISKGSVCAIRSVDISVAAVPASVDLMVAAVCCAASMSA